MFLPPSVQKEYALVFSGDPALALPTDETERENALRVARETGNWTPIVKAGDEPTLFYVEPMEPSTFTWLMAQRRRDRSSDDELMELALRLALKRVVNFGELEVSFETIGGHRVASLDVVNAIYRLGESIGKPQLGRVAVGELGLAVLERAKAGPSPK